MVPSCAAHGLTSQASQRRRHATMVSKGEFREITASRTARRMAAPPRPSPTAAGRASLGQQQQQHASAERPAVRRVSILLSDDEFLWLQQARGLASG